MRQTAVLALFVSVFGSSAFAVDPQLMNLVMPDAKILAGANGTNTRNSPLGQYIIGRITALNLDPQKIVGATGFDPLQDVTEALSASNANPAAPDSLVMVEGTFNVEKIVAFVSANPNVQVQTLPGATMLTFAAPNKKQTFAVAFIANSIAVGGTLADVQAALARNNGTAPASAIDPALAAQANQLSSSQDEWLVSTASVASLIPANAGANATGPAAQILPLLKNIQGFSGGFDFTDNVVLSGQLVASDAQNAAALTAVMKLAVTLASAGAGNNPQLGQLAQVLQTMQIAANGSAVNLTLSIPETQVEALLNQVLKTPATGVPASIRLRRRSIGN